MHFCFVCTDLMCLLQRFMHTIQQKIVLDFYWQVLKVQLWILWKNDEMYVSHNITKIWYWLQLTQFEKLKKNNYFIVQCFEHSGGAGEWAWRLELVLDLGGRLLWWIVYSRQRRPVCGCLSWIVQTFFSNLSRWCNLK